MIYEILIRGNNAGEIVGGHVIRFNENGGIGIAEEIPMVGQDLDFDGILPESLQNVIPLQELEKHYNAQIAEAKLKFDAELVETKSEFNTERTEAKIKFDAELGEAKAEFDRQIESAHKREAELTQQMAEAKAEFDLQTEALTQQLSEANHQIEQRETTIAQLQAQITALTAPKTPDWQRLALQWPLTEIGQVSRSTPEVDQTGLPLAILAQNADAARSAFVDIVEQLGDGVSDADIDEVDRLFKDCGV